MARLRTLKNALAPEVRVGDICQVAVQEEVATVSVVGRTAESPETVVSSAFAALGRRGTRVITTAQSITEHNISFVVPDKEVDDTVRFIHAELGLES